jgi:hypothetical protein
LIGGAVEPFEASLVVRDGAAVWTTCPLTDKRLDQVRELLKLGMTANDIGTELGVKRSTAYSLVKKAKEG